MLRDALVSAARADKRLIGAAMTGSAASGAEDRWSDIDLAVGVDAEADFDQTLADWTARLYDDHGALHHLDMVRGGTVYRVFLLPSTLQVDIAFSPAAEFGAIAPTFRLLFGTAEEQPHLPAPDRAFLVGLGWLYALHSRSSIARGRAWQAEYMISGLRDTVLSLACVRHDLPAHEGRGVDRLPADVTAGLDAALVRSLDGQELARAFGAATQALIAEIAEVDPDLSTRLTDPLRVLVG